MFFERTVNLHAGGSCIAGCMEYLTGCKSGRYSSGEQWAGLLKHANEVFSYGLEHGFVICGNSPDGRHAQEVLRDRYHREVILADLDDVRLELERNPERAFILASKKYCARYATALEKAPFYLNYNHLWILDPHFFEPVPALLKQAETNISDPRIEFLPYCLWDRNETVFFGECALNNMSGHIIEGTSGTGTNAVSLDRFLEGRPVTFIKMDIEGAEMRALRGAENSIKTYRPTLAISAYHMPDDLADIYLFCKSIGGYKLYLRTTECNLDYELVLYAVKG